MLKLKLTYLNIKQGKPHLLGFSNKNHFKRFSRTVCSAVEDFTEKQRDINGASPVVGDRLDSSIEAGENSFLNNELEDGGNSIYNFLYPSEELLPDDKEISIYDHLEESRERIFVSVLPVGAAIVGCFAFSKELIAFLEAPVREQGVRFLQLAPGEFFFASLKVRCCLVFLNLVFSIGYFYF
ncbi:hypothetical protein CDL12_22493 [Handroanthus impetiginosus]|uniref:Uncharacterized protein n=1 Tax=Handroanthus impetiginosus TaxID=429701 RepID=A0A2G9GI70_9LAMI|nr:hypothetical protein CDL12_22493 [Handroanthus impetiginosus]